MKNPALCLFIFLIFIFPLHARGQTVLQLEDSLRHIPIDNTELTDLIAGRLLSIDRYNNYAIRSLLNAHPRLSDHSFTDTLFARMIRADSLNPQPYYLYAMHGNFSQHRYYDTLKVFYLKKSIALDSNNLEAFLELANLNFGAFTTDICSPRDYHQGLQEDSAKKMYEIQDYTLQLRNLYINVWQISEQERRVLYNQLIDLAANGTQAEVDSFFTWHITQEDHNEAYRLFYKIRSPLQLMKLRHERYITYTEKAHRHSQEDAIVAKNCYELIWERFPAQRNKIRYMLIQLSYFLKDGDDEWKYPQTEMIHTDAQGYPLDTPACYFPPSLFINEINEGWMKDPGINIKCAYEQGEHYSKWFSEPLYILREPVMYHSPLPEETYRFTWIGSFHCPVVVRVTKICNRHRLIWKMEYHIGTEKKTLFREGSKKINKKKWKHFIALLDSTDFWHMSVRDWDLTGFDGSHWLLEGNRNGTYHITDRWSPREDLRYSACGKYLLHLIRKETGKRKFY